MLRSLVGSEMCIRDRYLHRSCDWGADHPSISLWIAEHKRTQDVLVYREWRKTQTDIDDIGLSIKEYTGDEQIEWTCIDHRKDMRRMLAKFGIPTVFATKGPGSVTERIILVNAALRRAQEGKPGGLYIWDGAVCNRDPNPVVRTRPNSLIAPSQTCLLYTSPSPRDS